MKTNFFTALAALNVIGDWQLTIKTGAHNRMLISVLFNREQVNDDAAKRIPPLLLKGTIEELDAGFFAAIQSPVQATDTLLTNLAEYEKAQSAARAASKMEKEGREKEKKEKDTVDKKYAAQMKEVDELEAAGKFREAYAQVPKVTDFPDMEAEIIERKEALTARFDQPSLF